MKCSGTQNGMSINLLSCMISIKNNKSVIRVSFFFYWSDLVDMYNKNVFLNEIFFHLCWNICAIMSEIIMYSSNFILFIIIPYIPFCVERTRTFRVLHIVFLTFLSSALCLFLENCQKHCFSLWATMFSSRTSVLISFIVFHFTS